MSAQGALSQSYTAADAADIHRLMERMRGEDPEYRVSSAHAHHYLYGERLTEDAVAAFERDRGIRLPDDYRSFLLLVGNGGIYRDPPKLMDTDFGPGPGCGLAPLERTVRGCDVSIPFPLTVSTDIEPHPEADDWLEKTAYPGMLEICYRAGGGFSFLVVNGPMYGTVWNVEWDAEPVQVHPAGLTFRGWYDRYLNILVDVALPLLARQRSIAHLQVGMTEAQVIEACGPAERRMAWPTFSHHYDLSYRDLATTFQMGADDTILRLYHWGIPTY